VSEFFQRVDTPAGEVRYHRPIEETRAAELLGMLDADKRLRFYIDLAHSMTVMGRATIHPSGNFDDKQARERWYWMNEMMHGVTLQIRAVHGTEPNLAYSPADFCRSMYEKARQGEFEGEFAVNCVSRDLWRQVKPSG
jgi:hypothetical protein